jgi:branched-chain amino acid transport system substrate-binding protein
LVLASAASAADTIKLGGMFPLSGRASDLGITCKQGAELAVKEINAKGGVLGKKFELLSADDKANVQEGVTLSKRYIQKDGVNFLFGVVSSGGSLAVAEVAKQEKVIFMDTVGSTDTLTKEKWNRYSFRAGTCNSQEANSLALYTASKYKNLTKFYNIGPDYEYGRTMWDIFKARTKEMNPKAEFIGEQWPKLFIPDYTSYINAILQAKPDAVFCTLWGGDLVAFSSRRSYGAYHNMKRIIATDRHQRGEGARQLDARRPDRHQRHFFPGRTPRNQEFVVAYQAEFMIIPAHGPRKDTTAFHHSPRINKAGSPRYG